MIVELHIYYIVHSVQFALIHCSHPTTKTINTSSSSRKLFLSQKVLTKTTVPYLANSKQTKIAGGVSWSWWRPTPKVK